MNILEINDGTPYLCKDKSEKYSVCKLTREELVGLFMNVYEDSEYYDFNVDDLENIKNPVEKEITKQLLVKIKEFSDNSEDLKKEFDDKFPELS